MRVFLTNDIILIMSHPEQTKFITDCLTLIKNDFDSGRIIVVNSLDRHYNWKKIVHKKLKQK